MNCELGILLRVVLVLGVSSAGAVEIPRIQSTIQAETKSPEKTQKTLRAPTGFTLIRMSNGVKDDGAPYSSNLYERASDKQRVWRDFFHYGSPEDVKKAFDVEVQKASKVVENGSLLDTEGQANGERAVLIFNPPNKKSSAMILTTYENQLRDIQSYSLDDALEFEKQAYSDTREKKQGSQ